MSLTSNWYFLQIRSSLLTSFLVGSFVVVVYSNISKQESWLKISYSVEFFSNFTKGCKCSWHFTNIGYKDFLSYSSTRATPYSLPTNEHTIWRLLYLGSRIKEIILWVFFLSKTFKSERKESSTLITSLLMLEANKYNSSVIIELLSIRLSNEGKNWFFFP